MKKNVMRLADRARRRRGCTCTDATIARTCTFPHLGVNAATRNNSVRVPVVRDARQFGVGAARIPIKAEQKESGLRGFVDKARRLLTKPLFSGRTR